MIERLLAAGNWRLAVGNWLLATDGLLLALLAKKIF
jgi:hypothetical protein